MMNIKNNWSVQISIYLFFFLLGMLIYRNNYFPVKTYRDLRNYVYPPKKISENHRKNKFLLCKYSPGMQLYTDRNYHDTMLDTALKVNYAILLPRHYNNSIKIIVNSDVEIYRPISIKNDNSPFRSWTKTDIKYNVVAPSSNHTQIVKKTFKKGIIILNSGGPISSSPILIRNINYNNLELPIRIIESKET